MELQCRLQPRKYKTVKEFHMLKIIVCIKIVADPEAPASTFKIDPAGQKVLPAPGVPPVLSPYDENALEAALKIKGKQEAKITVISAGKNIPKAIIKKSLAVGADELIVIEDAALEGVDSFTTAGILAAAVKKSGEYNLILTGRMAADTNGGQVGTALAEMLGIPAVTVARKITVSGGSVQVEQVLNDGYEVIETSLPCLVTVSNETGELRMASVKGLMAAQKQPFTAWKVSDLATEMPKNRQKSLKLFVPERKVQCELATGETPEEAGANLALKMREAGKLGGK
jgi:electron transfer flavoprotein beta subunit